jgi:PrgI family protein
MTGERCSRSRVRIPADVEREDRLLGNLTARQLAILGVAGIVLWMGYTSTRHLVPLAVFGAVAAPITALAGILAMGRFEGMSADRLLIAASRQVRSPRRLVPAPDGIPPTPGFVGISPGPVPAPLRLPFTGINQDGTIDLGPDGVAVVCRAGAVTFSLRTPTEQEALVAGFARYLNSLDQPAQIVIRAEPVDLEPAIARLHQAAPGLPHPGLEHAARQHAAFLADLAERRDLLRREVLLVLRQPGGDGAAGRLRRRAEDATIALAASGVTLAVLDGPAVASCLSGALDPFALRAAGLFGTDEPVTFGGQR